jgi:enoyl-CoA hydratase
MLQALDVHEVCEMDFERIEIEFSDRFAYITLNRPDKLNALDRKTRSELLIALDEVENSARVMMLKGSGRAFAAGADIYELSKRSPLECIDFAKFGTDLFTRIEELEIPSIAIINGFALGAGCELAMACDIRVASFKAKFGLPEINLGIIPGSGGTQRLPRLVGMGMAKKLILTGEMISAEEAYRIGLIDVLVDEKELMNKAKEIGMKIAEKSPVAVSFAKKAVNAYYSMSLKDGLKYELSLFSVLVSTEDAKEGLKAFMEKRKPEFKGK